MYRTIDFSFWLFIIPVKKNDRLYKYMHKSFTHAIDFYKKIIVVVVMVVVVMVVVGGGGGGCGG